MRAAKSEFDWRDVAIAVVSFAAPVRLAAYQERHRWPFIMLADPERVAYRVFSLKRLSWYRVFSPATLKLYFKLLLDRGLKREAYGGDDIYQGGGDFLLDGEGRLLYAYQSQDPADRPSAQKLLSAIDTFIGAP